MRSRSPHVLMVVAALALCTTTAASGATETPEVPRPAEAAAKGNAASITLVRQPPWVAPESAADFTLDVDEPDGPAEIRVIVHRAVTSRGALRQALAGTRLGAVEGRLSVPVSELPAAEGDGHRTLTLGVEGTTPDPQRLVPGRTGVYPVEIDLLGRTGRLAGFITSLVVLAPGVVPLTVSWVWPLDATPAHLPNGEIRPAAARALAPGGRLARLVGAAAEYADVPLTLAPTPETLEAWADSGAGDQDGEGTAQTLAVAKSVLPPVPGGTTRQVLAGPYVPIDVPATLASDLDTEVDDQFFRGPAALAEVLGPGLSPATVLASELDVPALARLRLYGTERLVVSPSALEPVGQRLTPGRPFLLSGRGKDFTAAVDDPDLAGMLEADEPPGLQAARFLAALSLVALEAPREPRGVVVVAPTGWDPPARLLGSVLSSLRGHPALAPKTLDQFFAEVAPETGPDGTMQRSVAEADAAGQPFLTREIGRLRSELAAFSDVVGENQSVPRAADRSVLIAQADRLPDTGPTSAGAYLAGADQLMDDLTGRIRGPQGQRVTLTARKATIPISLLNPTAQPLTVRVRLESDQLLFPEGAERLVTLPPENTTENFKVETRASGAFPLTILVTSPDGRLTVNRSELTVRSTVVSGVGALLTAGAGMFLVLWWANDLRRSRRRRAGRRGGRSTAPEGGVFAPAGPNIE